MALYTVAASDTQGGKRSFLVVTLHEQDGDDVFVSAGI